MFRIFRIETLVGILAAVLAFGTSFHARPALAQPSSELVAIWMVTVEGDARARIFRVQGAEEKADGSVALKGRYGYADGNLGAVSGEITSTPAGRKLVLTTNADSVIVAVQSADGAFSGTLTSKTGVVKPVKLAKTNTAEIASLPRTSAEDAGAKGSKGSTAGNSEITMVYWSSQDCPYCRLWEGSLGMYGKFKAMPEFAKIKFYTVKNESLRFGYNESHFPPEISWVWERYQKTQRQPGRPGWQIYVGRKFVASFQGAQKWEEDHLPKIKQIIAENSVQ